MQSILEIVQLFNKTSPLILDNEQVLSKVTVAYETYGTLNSNGTNAILVCHALTGDAHAAGESEIDPGQLKKLPFYTFLKSGTKGWWHGMIGPGKTFDTDKYFVINFHYQFCKLLCNDKR